MSAAPPGVALDSMRHALGNEGPLLARLPELALPVVAINPAEQGTDVEALARHGVSTVLVPHVGHFLMLEDPDGVNEVLVSVIDRLH